jgi:hypothetical protein
MTAEKWINAVVGKYVDYDGVYGAQCVDLIKKYFVEVIGIPAIRNNAKDYWTNYPTAHFTRITNTPSFLPKRGDIMIWGTAVGQYGHIAIIDTANLNTFVSLDQNWPFSNGTTPAKRITHNYNGVLGVLRPKKDVNFDQAAYDAAQKAQAKAAAAAKAAADAAAKAKAEAELAAAKAEAERLAAEKAEADRIAQEQAEAEKKEQARLAAEQKRLEEVLEAQKQAENSWKNILLRILDVITKFFKGEL